FPVDVAIAMGADIVIGVDITADTSQIDEDSNIVSIIDKISSYTGNRSTALHKQLANILIVPDVKDHNTVNFSNLDVLVKEGENAAHKHDNILKKLRNEERFQE
ncbi:patatin-like phospholipase, partial [Fusobacterium necrophorum subsp. funduliforme B35]